MTTPNELTDEAYQALAEANPGKRLLRIKTPAGEIVARQPTRAEHSAFQRLYFDKDTPAPVAYHNLLTMTAVSPLPPVLASWLDAWPGLPMNPAVVKALDILAGVRAADEAKS